MYDVITHLTIFSGKQYPDHFDVNLLDDINFIKLLIVPSESTGIFKECLGPSISEFNIQDAISQT